MAKQGTEGFPEELFVTLSKTTHDDIILLTHEDINEIESDEKPRQRVGIYRLSEVKVLKVTRELK